MNIEAGFLAGSRFFPYFFSRSSASSVVNPCNEVSRSLNTSFSGSLYHSLFILLLSGELLWFLSESGVNFMLYFNLL